MSHITLYRKWRPRTFDEVKGQDATVRILTNQIATNRIGHAYLFCGTRGTGKTSVAKIFAAAVNCETPKDGSPCLACDTCRQLSGANFDIIEIDAASNNGVDNVREIRSEVEYLPTTGRYKVYIIDEVHMLSSGAFNALLKTLEEPPKHVIFILATTEVQKLPVTILSRCQRYDFRRIPDTVIADRIAEVLAAEDIRMTRAAIDYIATLADGALRDALSILEQCVSFRTEAELTLESVQKLLGKDGFKMYHQLFRRLLDRDLTGLNQDIGHLLSTGKTVPTVVEEWTEYLKNLAMMSVAGELPVDLPASEQRCLLEDVDEMQAEELLVLLRILTKMQADMKYVENKRMMLDMGLIRMFLPRTASDDADLVARIASLERRLDNLKTVQALPSQPAASKSATDEERPNPTSFGLTDAEDEETVAALREDLVSILKKWGDFRQQLTAPLSLLLERAKLNIRGDNLVIIAEKEFDYNLLNTRREQLDTALKEYFKLEIAFEMMAPIDGVTNHEQFDLLHSIGMKVDIIGG